MVQIMKASELAELAKEGKIQFEKDVLEGPQFKKLINDIEDAALKGFTGYQDYLDSNHDVRVYEIFIENLKEAGFKAEIKKIEERGLMGPYFREVFEVSWKEEAE